METVNAISTIDGGMAADQRGDIRFVNDFDMAVVRRFYIITNRDTETVRGWRAHRIEQRWFYVTRGCFRLDIVRIDDWEKPSVDLPVERLILKAEGQQIIHLPVGYGTAFQALEEGSELLVFADYGIEHAKLDDYTYPPDYFWGRLVGDA